MVAVIGGGSFGTTLAILMAAKGEPVTQYVRDAELAGIMRDRRENTKYLPGAKIPLNVWVTESLPEAAANASVLVMAVPSQAVREQAAKVAPHVKDGGIVVSLAKGLEFNRDGSIRRMSEVLEEELPRAKVVALSGPNLAHEIAAGNPTATVIASRHADALAEVKRALEAPTFKVYPHADLVGVELGGVLKNITAIAAGMSDGMGYGRNTKSALVSLGLSEMIRFGRHFGAKKETFLGLAGLGDVIATCHSRKSRNHYVGEQLARGEKLEDVVRSLGGEVAEGVTTTKFVGEYARAHDIALPMTEQVYAILYENRTVKDAIESLLRLI